MEKNIKNYQIPSQTENSLSEDTEESTAVFLSGKTRFNGEKFHVKNDSIKTISCGDEHGGVVTESGRIFMFGSNNWGQLGLGHEKIVEKPSCVKSLKHEKAKLIACGRCHTIISTENGSLYAFGSNSEHQLGLGEVSSQVFNLPQKIDVAQKKWKCLAAGASFSCALTESGELFVWGSNEYGELGIDNADEIKNPRLVGIEFKILKIASGYYHTAVISHDAKLYTSGSNELGQLGLEEKITNSKHFTPVNEIKEPICDVSCGGNHTLALTKNGLVYSFGDNSKGQLGKGVEERKCFIPQKIKLPSGLVIKKLSCGESSSAFITDIGHLYSFGDNSHKKLGIDKLECHSNPTIVEKYKELNVKMVSCGGTMMAIIGNIMTKHMIEHNEENITHLNASSKTIQNQNENESLGKFKRADNQSMKTNNQKNVYSFETDFKDDLESSLSLNRTHTLTKENKFLLLSELNLKKLANEDESKIGINDKKENASIKYSDRKFKTSFEDAKIINLKAASERNSFEEEKLKQNSFNTEAKSKDSANTLTLAKNNTRKNERPNQDEVDMRLNDNSKQASEIDVKNRNSNKSELEQKNTKREPQKAKICSIL